MAKDLPVTSTPERIAEELRQLLVHPRRTRGLNLLMDLGLADAILPELREMKGLPQGLPSQPTGDLWDHVMNVLVTTAPLRRFRWQWGRCCTTSASRCRANGQAAHSFYHHEHVGARMADAIALRLKLSNAERGESSGWSKNTSTSPMRCRYALASSRRF